MSNPRDGFSFDDTLRTDWGRRKVSDIGDVAPPTRVYANNDGDFNLTVPKVVQRVRDTCCAEAKAAIAAAQMANALAAQASTALAGVNNKPADGKCGGPCSATLLIEIRKITIVRQRPKPPSNVGQITTKQGMQGQGVGSVVVGQIKRCFNSAVAAKAAAQQLIAATRRRNENYEFENGKIYEFGPNGVSPDLGLIPGTGKPCPEPAPKDRKVIGNEENIKDHGTGWGDK